MPPPGAIALHPVTLMPTEESPREAMLARIQRIRAKRAQEGSQIQIQIQIQEAARFAAEEAAHKEEAARLAEALHTQSSSPTSPLIPADLFASQKKASNKIPRCLTAAADALDDVSRESEDHGAPDAYCASTDGTVQQGTAQPDTPSPRSSTPPSDKPGYSCELDACSDDEHDGSCNGSSVLDTSEDSDSAFRAPRLPLQTQLDRLQDDVDMQFTRQRPPAARSCDDADHHAASEAPTRNYSRSESSNSFDGTASNSTDGYRQGTDTAPTRSTLPSRPELAHGFTDPGPRSEQTQYAGSGGWLDNIPPGRPDGIWQIHADWLKPGEELTTEPEFDAILAHLAATPMP